VSLRSDDKYMLLTTFRRSGAGVSTPVWLVDIGNGEVGFYTSSQSGKAKRLRYTERVTVQPCNMKGDPSPDSAPAETTARIITGPEYDMMRRKIVAKYGFMTKVTKFLAQAVGFVRRKPFPYGDIGIAVKLPAQS
jgi:uncharacterized protein